MTESILPHDSRDVIAGRDYRFVAFFAIVANNIYVRSVLPISNQVSLADMVGGIALVTVFITLSPDWEGRLVLGAMLLGIMLLDLAAMLLARHILHFLGVFLQILGAVLAIIQVALGLQIILNSFQRLWP